MRLLDAAGIPYRTMEYEVDENDLSGVHVAQQLGQDPDTCFKTLVLKGEKTGYLVCCIPVAEELDLKKTLPGAAGDKKVEDASHEGASSHHRLYPGWLFPDRNEEEVPRTYIEETAVLF